MGLFKRVLVPIDGSENSKRAVETVRELAGDGGLNVTLIHVVQPVYQTVGPYGDYTDIASLISSHEEYGQKILNEAKELLENAGIDVDTQLVLGWRGQEICKLAEKEAYDLIVMGRRGISRLEEVVLGSVSEYVVRHSKLPVLLVQ